jgi:hypothetical protein
MTDSMIKIRPPLLMAAQQFFENRLAAAIVPVVNDPLEEVSTACGGQLNALRFLGTRGESVKQRYPRVGSSPQELAPMRSTSWEMA